MKSSEGNLDSGPKNVFAAVAKIYDISPKGAEAVVAYHGAFRLNAGSLLNASRNVGYFETKEGNVSRGLGLLAKIASLFPGGSAAEIGVEAVKGIDQFKNEKELSKVAQIALIVERNMHEAVKSLATQVTESSIDEIKSLTPEAARKMAKKDVTRLKEKMIEGKFDALVAPSQAVSLLLNKDKETEIVGELVHKMWLEVDRGKGENFEEEKISREKAKSEAKAVVQKNSYESSHPIVGHHSQEAVAHRNSAAINTR